jgi:hypothetical protein
MAVLLAPLPATMVVQVRSPVPSGPSISVHMEKVALFCNPASETRSQTLQLRLWIGSKFAVAKAKVFPYLETRWTWNTEFEGQL